MPPSRRRPRVLFQPSGNSEVVSSNAYSLHSQGGAFPPPSPNVRRISLPMDYSDDDDTDYDGDGADTDVPVQQHNIYNDRQDETNGTTFPPFPIASFSRDGKQIVVGTATLRSEQWSKNITCRQSTDSYGSDTLFDHTKGPSLGGGNDDGKEGKCSIGYEVYAARWTMLGYLSIMNLLSDWTCYSVAPIARMVVEAYGAIRPTVLVCGFLGANALATASEPIILSRLGLRRTIILGSLLLMIGSVIKSGLPYFYTPSPSTAPWRVYIAFFIVGLSQPLYQCTPALLSASWFPEKERTMATGIALNSNQVGIGCAFVFGTWLVESHDDIPMYFSFMTMLSIIIFIGVCLQFDDAPPTPPSSTARIIRGTFTVPLPKTSDIWRLVPSWDDACGRPAILLAHTIDGSALCSGSLGSPHDHSRTVVQPAPFMTPKKEELSFLSAPFSGKSAATATPFAGLQKDDISIEEESYFVPTPLPALADLIEEGAEPVAISSKHNLQVNVRDDQIILSVRALWRRSGFVHSLVAFVISAIVINTLSTYMDYLVKAGGGNRKTLGVVGGTFQIVVMASSLLFGKLADKTRSYYFVTISLLLAGALALGYAGMALDEEERRSDLYASLLAVAATVGPLQPIATEMGVEIAFPLSENTVLVAQQLFANLLSTCFIPLFDVFRDFGTEVRSQYTFSFYLLILMHACATVFFATFTGKYRRLSHEMETNSVGKVVHESEKWPLIAGKDDQSAYFSTTAQI
mmetsp:Transcript_24937/g.57595  ORF Transcript_24937/g.57595 Transcript_24937/m.57595 type:complete len:745 (-) Transcript_24937:339-2573(-)|eukprot:CAMPEP_0113307646 /NCGR_PEP_ID=MMETSP0010_2-20120614/6411_1 /TAXON_ID=216773 ORGANISM="Corethron hystrix, Strain 308" /NCGR_SAMPLE_ID=MMETSP0010_2 /ASSEMBLY_ACC=CAM_ASM_000155 /LENGTH=744 /DNA_ID=CAMNT_0000162549 /DNA_START=1319 /DNA_END=3553 /DNA_ORIENTATION=- /assembly_acc=CAM_ASM_000155